MYRILIRFFFLFIKFIKLFQKSKNDLIIENLVLRQQLATYKSKKVKSKLIDVDRSFWIAIKQSWNKWKDYLIIVKPETIIVWQNRRFRNHVFVFNENHLRRLMKEYVDYYNKDRCHLTLNRDSPMGRKVENKPLSNSNVKSSPILGRIHHKYTWNKAA